jgi:hypothetical protein
VNDKELFLEKGKTVGWKGKYTFKYNNDIK